MTKLNINESHYLNLRASAPARLAVLRSAAAYTNAPDVNLPPSMRYATWREARRTTFRTLDTGLAQGFNSKTVWAWGKSTETRRPVWYTHDRSEHFRDERYADDVEDAGIDHTGWFSDADCDEKIRGIVGRLTHGRFVAGYIMTMNDERVYFAKVFDCEKEAAQYADSEAESLAEDEKEHSERWNEARNLADDVDELKNDISELFAMRHHGRARRELTQAIETMRTKRDELTNDYADIEL